MKIEDSKKQCVKCKYRIDRLTCKAFPNGLPLLFILGKAEHDEFVDGQEGDFIFEPHPRFKHQYDESRNINEEKQVRFLYLTYKKKLPKLIIEEISKRGFDVKKIDIIYYKARRSNDGFYSAEINLFPNAERITLGSGLNDKESFEYEIYRTFGMINYIEKIKDYSNESIHLKIHKSGKYNYIGPPNMPSWGDFAVLDDNDA